MPLSLKHQMQGVDPDQMIGFRLSQDDYQLVCREIERRGLTKSQFFRMLIAGFFAYQSAATASTNNANNAETPVCLAGVPTVTST